jgi:hypothetical protein
MVMQILKRKFMCRLNTNKVRDVSSLWSVRRIGDLMVFRLTYDDFIIVLGTALFFWSMNADGPSLTKVM